MAEPEVPEVVLVDRRTDPAVLHQPVERRFEDIVKYFVDIARGIASDPIPVDCCL
jgi:hypothetical protein